VPVRPVAARGASVLVEFERGGMPYRSYVDVADLQAGGVLAERLEDAPCGIVWDIDLAGMERDVEKAIKRAGIWTYEDLKQKDRAIIRIATDLLGKAIWDAAKRSCKEAK
jgi:hypothetical protein